jgi:hypothetical protein
LLRTSASGIAKVAETVALGARSFIEAFSRKPETVHESFFNLSRT